MRADEAVALTHRMLTAVGIRRFVSVEKFITHPTRFGTYCHDNRAIYLNESYLTDDAEMRETIAHECAHAMTVADREHGLPFQAALIHVRKLMTAEQRTRCRAEPGPQSDI
jgi:hypothetical protein